LDGSGGPRVGSRRARNWRSALVLLPRGLEAERYDLDDREVHRLHSMVQDKGTAVASVLPAGVI
jgi:hypothetical protein